MAAKQAPKRERASALVIPTYSLKSLKTGDSIFVRIDSEISSKPDLDEKTGQQKTDKRGDPAFLHLVNVTDLDTGVIGQMVLPVIIYGALKDVSDLVGREFEFVKGEANTGKATKWEVYGLA